MVCSLPGAFLAGQRISRGNSVRLIDKIHRDYPYQVTISLDAPATGILDWLDARIGRWDMYVDLNSQAIRYCFRDLADASAFSRRFQKREAI